MNDRNDEARMTDDEGSPNVQMTKSIAFSGSGSSFVILSSLGIRHSSFF
jgi:hypothetical protein